MYLTESGVGRRGVGAGGSRIGVQCLAGIGTPRGERRDRVFIRPRTSVSQWTHPRSSGSGEPSYNAIRPHPSGSGEPSYNAIRSPPSGSGEPSYNGGLGPQSRSGEPSYNVPRSSPVQDKSLSRLPLAMACLSASDTSA